MSIILYGDPHEGFEPLFEACAEHRPTDVLILGDLELDCPFSVKMEPLTAMGIRSWFIHGNHDAGTAEQYDFLWGDAPEANLHGRVQTFDIGGRAIRIGGLGGVYRGKIWYPTTEQAPARFHDRQQYISSTSRSNLWRSGLPLRQRETIFPEDHEILSRQRCDILVCHEAPSPHDHGFPVINTLARQMGAKAIIHGHHHRSYVDRTSEIEVRGLAIAETYLLSEFPK